MGESAGEIRILDIALLPGFQGKGIGSHILKRLIKKVAEEQKILSLHVKPQNPAVKLYLRLGFEHTRDNGDHYYMEYRPSSFS